MNPRKSADLDPEPAGGASSAARPLLSIGWLAKGFLFVVIGILALEIARRGWSRHEADQNGALASLTDVTAGRVLVLAMAVGIGAYALWQLWAAIVADTDGVVAAVKRIGWLGLALTYALLAEHAFITAVRGSPPEDSDEGPASPAGVADRLLDVPAGRWMIGVIGLGAAGVGIYNLWKALSKDFLDDIDSDDLSPLHRRVLVMVGGAGFVARALLLVVVGWLFVDAARRQRSGRAAGIDGALEEMSRALGGTILLAATGVGLVAAGLYDMVTFRRQRIT